MSAGVRGATAVDELLSRAVTHPVDALVEADRVLATRPDPLRASVARQARGIVLRDRGRTGEAIAELRHAARLAARSAEPQRLADAEATLGLTLGLAGRVTEGRAALGRAVRTGRGVVRARALMRRASLARTLGGHEEALADLRQAIALLRRGGDGVWEARSRMHRFLVYSALGQTTRADRDLDVAQRLFAVAGQDLESAMAVHNRADVAFMAGNLPVALGFLDEAGARYAALQAYRPTLAIDRCAVLLAAGLAEEAVAATEEALAHNAEPTRRAELLFAAAQAALAAGRPSLARDRAAQARDLFRRQGRPGWQARAAFVLLQSRYVAGADDARLRRQAGLLAEELDAGKAPEAVVALLLAGRVAAAHGRTADADRHLARAARFRHRGPSYGRAAGWLAQALRARSVPAMLAACRRGLDAAGEHLRALAAPELRAHAAAYGVELALLAQREAVRRGDGRMLLRWSERWRAGALAVPPVPVVEDRELTADLAALRGVVRDLSAAPGDPALEERRRGLEESIRARTRRTVGVHPPDVSPADLATLHDGLGGHRLVELTSVDGILWATTMIERRVRLHRVGPVDAAVREIELARFTLRRLARGRAHAGAFGALAVTGRRLQEALLGTAAAELDGAPVVVVPPARLHAVPWGMLPALRAAPFVVAPSAQVWLRAGEVRPPRGRRIALVIGPGLPGAAAEVRRIGAVHPDAFVLADGRATAEATLAALDGAWTAHVAAHGVFRADNPLFSALALDDGPLTVYDLARLRRAPQRLVLASCESAVAAQVGADELLGMVSALVPLGTASLLASVVPVNDVATAPLMVGFHRGLRAGHSFGDALRAVRVAADRDGDAVGAGAALSLVALGR